jgi:hypothetical protein
VQIGRCLAWARRTAGGTGEWHGVARDEDSGCSVLAAAGELALRTAVTPQVVGSVWHGFGTTASMSRIREGRGGTARRPGRGVAERNRHAFTNVVMT